MAENLTLAQTAIRLCNISYAGTASIGSEVNTTLGMDVVWGPAEHFRDLVSDSLMYVANNPATNDYYVVIRGTNMDSWYSIQEEDFAISSVVEFSKYVPSAPAGAVISQGTATGMDLLISLTAPGSGMDVVTYLKDILENYSINNLYVTGHSLGGTLTPPFYLYLVNQLYGSPSPKNCIPCSFAGITPGNEAFNDFFNSYIQSGLQWRYFNPLDMIPNCWWSLDNLKNLYAANNLAWGWPEDSIFTNLFAEGAPFGYVQPRGGEVRLPGQFRSNFPDDDFWTLQAAYQHHSTTYLALVDSISQ